MVTANSSQLERKPLPEGKKTIPKVQLYFRYSSIKFQNLLTLPLICFSSCRLPTWHCVYISSICRSAQFSELLLPLVVNYQLPLFCDAICFHSNRPGSSWVMLVGVGRCWKTWLGNGWFQLVQIEPFPKSDQVWIPPQASQVIFHHTVWRTWLFTA